MTKISRGRMYPGLAAIAVGVLFNPWSAARFLSPDGKLAAESILLIFGFDGVMILVGLLCLLASRSLIVGLSLSVVAGLVALVVLDLVARPVLRSQLYYQPEAMYKDRLPELPSLALFAANVSYSGQTWGDLAAMTTQDSLREIRSVVFRTDGYGYRNDISNIDTSKPLDLIILGDSFGAGAGTSQKEVWSVLFHEKYGLNTYNLSMPGYGPWNELLAFKRELPRLKLGPQTTVLWAIFAGNDIDEPCFTELNPEASGSWKRLAVRMRTFYRRSPIKIITERAMMSLSTEVRQDTAIISFLPDGSRILFYSAYVRHERRSLDDLKQLKNLPMLRLVFADMARVAKMAGLNVVVAYLPTKYAIYGWVLDHATPWNGGCVRTPTSLVLEKLCQESCLPFLDLQPQLAEEAQRQYAHSGKLLWWRDDTHWNGNGHEAAAKAVGEYLATARHNPDLETDAIK